MQALEIFSQLSEEQKERLADLWEEIGGLENELGCRATPYAFHRFMHEALVDKEFLGVIIYGKKGGGKSTYSIKSVATYYMRAEDMECGEAYQRALMALVFSPRDLLEKIEHGAEIIIWDDAGLWGSTYMWFDPVMRRYLEALLDWYDVARTDVSVLIMTTPSKKKLPPRIREDADAVIARVNKHGVKTYNGKRLKTAVIMAARNIEGIYDDRLLRQELFRDYFTVYLPDPVYEYYRIIRNAYSRYARRKLRNIVDLVEEEGDQLLLKMLRKRLGIDDEQ